MNIVIQRGNLGGSPVIKTKGDVTSVRFSYAVNSWDRKRPPQWYSAVAFGNLAKTLGQLAAPTGFARTPKARAAGGWSRWRPPGSRGRLAMHPLVSVRGRVVTAAVGTPVADAWLQVIAKPVFEFAGAVPNVGVRALARSRFKPAPA
jgi:hypothetical protein